MKRTLHPSLPWLIALICLLLLIITFSALSLRVAEPTPTPWMAVSIPTLHQTASPTPGWWETFPTAQPLTSEN